MENVEDVKNDAGAQSHLAVGLGEVDERFVSVNAAFHKLWSKAAIMPDYEKSEWKAMAAELLKLGVAV